MPQMAPINWTLLMIMFIMLNIMINMMMYYTKNYKTSSKFLKKSKLSVNWKW